MKIKFTIPTDGYQAGLEYNLSEEEAQIYLDNDVAVLVEDVKNQEKPKPKKVKYDTRQNDS